MKKYTQEVTVTESHLDQLQHVNNVQYLQWVQDIAGAHWQSLVKGSKETFGLWVVRSHHIEYKRQAKLGDVLLIETHVALTEGFLSERKVRFLFYGNQKLSCSMYYSMVLPRPQHAETYTYSPKHNGFVCSMKYFIKYMCFLMDLIE